MILLNLIVGSFFFSFFLSNIKLLLDRDEMIDKTIKKTRRNLNEKKSSRSSTTKKLLSTIFCCCIPSR